jgi:hypothetical protein
MPPANGVPGADAVVPPLEAGPLPPEDLPADVVEPPPTPKATPPAGDETIPPAEVVPSAEIDSDEAAFPDDPRMVPEEVCGDAGPDARSGVSDALVPSCSDAPTSRSIFKGETKCRDRGAKLNCHKQTACAVIETRRSHEKRAVSKLSSTFSTTGSAQLLTGSRLPPAVAGMRRAMPIQASVLRCRREFVVSDSPLGIPLCRSLALRAMPTCRLNSRFPSALGRRRRFR